MKARIGNSRGTKKPVAKPCKFPGCIRSPRGGARGYCPGHYAQILRGRELAPLRERGKGVVRLSGLTLPVETVEVLAALGPTIYEAARLVLNEWAAKRRQMMNGNGKR